MGADFEIVLRKRKYDFKAVAEFYALEPSPCDFQASRWKCRNAFPVFRSSSGGCEVSSCSSGWQPEAIKSNVFNFTFAGNQLDFPQILERSPSGAYRVQEPTGELPEESWRIS